MTYRQLLYKADRLLNSNEITLGEYEIMTAFLDEEVVSVGVKNIPKSTKDLFKLLDSLNNNCAIWGITKKDLSVQLGVSRATIYNWFDKPNMEKINKLYIAFDTLKKKEIMNDIKRSHKKA